MQKLYQHGASRLVSTPAAQACQHFSTLRLKPSLVSQFNMKLKC
jgi:hypothetical protein